MKRMVPYILTALVLAALVACAGGLSWLLKTPEGARWLFRAVSRNTPVKIAARLVEGGIGTALRLEGVSMQWPQGEVAAENLRLRWQPLLLLFGKVDIQELSARRVHIQDDEPVREKPPELVWPRASGIPAWLDARIDHLQVDGLSYRRLDQPAVAVTTMSAELAWRDSLLSLVKLSMSSPEGRIDGAISAGFRRPSLKLSLAIVPSQAVAGLSRFDLRAGLSPGRPPEQAAGKVTIIGMSGPRQSLELAGEAGVARNAINLRDLQLIQSGRRGTLRGEGTVLLTTGDPHVHLQLRASALDLSPELHTATDISGSLALDGTVERYSGRFALVNKGAGWQAARLNGSIRGDAQGVSLHGLDGSLLNGTVRGGVQVGWRDGVSLAGAIQGRNLNPARVTSEWSGAVNFDLAGEARWFVDGRMEGNASGRLLESSLRGKTLTGDIAARVTDDNLRIDRLALVGKGFALHADGELRDRLDVSAQITDLSGLVPNTAGRLTLSGWVRHAAGRTSGTLSARSRDLAANGVRIASSELSARLDDGPGKSLDVTAGLHGAAFHHLRLDDAFLKVSGGLDRHTVELALRSAGAEVSAALTGTYARETWEGEIARLSGRDAVGPWRIASPAALRISSHTVVLSPLVVNGIQTERLELGGQLFRDPLHGELKAAWRDLDLGRARQWLTDVDLSGHSSGIVRLDSPDGERLTLAGHATASGMVTVGKRTVTISQASLGVEANERGVLSTVELRTAEGISLSGRFSSSLPARLAIPEEGEMSAMWRGADLALFHAWIPSGTGLKGQLSGDLSGRLLPGTRLDVKGNATLDGGEVRWRGDGREFLARVRTAGVSWVWRGDTLSGKASLALAEYGEANGSFQIPLSARLPTSLDSAGPVRAVVTGRLREKGVLTSLFPGLLQETRGELDVDLRVDGTWEGTQVVGKLGLSQAEAFLPAAGISLKDVRLTAHLERDTVRIDTFTVRSGPGALEGSATIQLKGSQMVGYRGTVRGERFQAVYHPELQALVSPDLTFEGTGDKLSARGVIRLPELLVQDQKSKGGVQPSRDAIVDRDNVPAAKKPRQLFDILVKVALGDRVIVKAEGLDAQLEGSVELAIRGPDDMKGTGEIKVTKGNYSAYGVKLDIKRGRVIFAGGPVDRPSLDILALREIDDVRAGVTVAGTPESPVVKLYSEPAMPDVDILGYIVLGHKLSEGEEKTDLLVKAASMLVTSGQSVFLQEQIKQRLGVDTLEFRSEKQQMPGYKPVETTLGVAKTKETTSGGVSQSMLQVGKYLTPKLYFSYGWSLFDDRHLFLMRYNITKQWEIETSSGTDASGADLFYKIEFD